MEKLTQTFDNQVSVEATFAPQRGMNLMSLKRGGVEVMDPLTMPLFEERMAGLGALIGPHFHHRSDSAIPNVDVWSLFPFLQALKDKGQKEPFSHGVARYAAWNYQVEGHKIKAYLCGEDRLGPYSLAEIEGYDFELQFSAELIQDGISIQYGFESEKPGVIGLHYYYALADKSATVHAQVHPQYHTSSGWRDIPKEWLSSDQNLKLEISPSLELDEGFRPVEPNLIRLNTSQYQLEIAYSSNQQEHAWQLYHPKDASFVCVEPVTANNPREAVLKSSALSVQLKVGDPA